MGVAETPAGRPAHTDGRTVFVSAGRSPAEQRRELLLQCALLGAGSLDPGYARRLRGRTWVARRYLALEGHRVLAGLADRVPAAADLRPGTVPVTDGPEASLARARGRGRVPDPPDWFGVLRPALLLGAPPAPGGRPGDRQLRLAVDPADLPPEDDDEPEDDEDDPAERSRILRLFENPAMAPRTVADFLSRLFGTSRAAADAAGADLPVRSLRRGRSGGPDGRPLPTRIRFTADDRPVTGVGGVLLPEWDVHAGRYRPDWCRVLDFPLTVPAFVADGGVTPDPVLRRRLARVGLGPAVVRRRPDGEDLDTDALVDLAVDVRSGHASAERIHRERRRLARDLGVLILIDSSGSASDADPAGRAVHDHQRRAAATLAATLAELGDRVAVHAFRSQGRRAVHLPAVAAFGQPFGAVAHARLNQLQPSGYTRLGAGIRGAAEILKARAGTPHRLLLVLSDGILHDEGYEGRYAEEDVARAVAELHADGLAALCLTIGAATPPAALARAFGPAGHAAAPTLTDLSPRMDELFLGALRHLAAPTAARR